MEAETPFALSSAKKPARSVTERCTPESTARKLGSPWLQRGLRDRPELPALPIRERVGLGTSVRTTGYAMSHQAWRTGDHTCVTRDASGAASPGCSPEARGPRGPKSSGGDGHGDSSATAASHSLSLPCSGGRLGSSCGQDC